jgi:hypothetical protein
VNDARSYYRGPNISVTRKYFVRGGDRFLIAEITRVGTARGPASRRAVAGAIVAAVEIAILVPVVVLFPSTTSVLLAAVAVLAPLTFAFVEHRRNPREWILVAIYQGEKVLLFRNSNGRAFEGVAWALRRALESSGHDWRVMAPED